jgi:hypothetical protein
MTISPAWCVASSPTTAPTRRSPAQHRCGTWVLGFSQLEEYNRVCGCYNEDITECVVAITAYKVTSSAEVQLLAYCFPC